MKKKTHVQIEKRSERKRNEKESSIQSEERNTGGAFLSLTHRIFFSLEMPFLIQKKQFSEYA